jgi:hypothetical protein
MKLRIFALILTLSLVVWAQETPSGSATPNSTPATQAKGCHHMANAKDAKDAACCHHSADAKDAGGCCGKDKCEMKDSKACMEECKKDGGCTEGNCCKKGASDKTAASCCGDKCERHQHTPAVS